MKNHDVHKVIVLLKNAWMNPSVRNIAKVMSKENSLLSIQNAINKLIEVGVIHRDEKWVIQITNTLTSVKQPNMKDDIN